MTRNISEIPILTKGNRVAATPEAKTTLLGETFCNNFNSSSPSLSHNDLILMPRSPDTPRIYSDLLCMESEIFDLLASFDISIATCPDGISAQMLKYTAETITPIITSLFNQSILTGTVPDLRHVVPIHKQGDKSNPGNYRPISLLPIISVRSWNNTLLKSSVPFFPSQTNSGGRSTTGAILSAIHDWQGHLDKGADVQTFFFDLQKAFGSVPHGQLINKLISLNVPTPLISWITSYLYNRKQQVVVSGANSNPVIVTSGVPQGSVLGPFLFLIIIIDGLTNIPLSGGSLVLFADDLLLHKVIHTTYDFQALQEDVNSMDR